MAEAEAYSIDQIHKVRYDVDGNGNSTLIVKAEITSGGSGGGAVTVADGADVTLGAIADAAVVDPSSSASVVAALKGLLSQNRATTLTLLASAARTATATSTAQQNYSYRRLIIVVNITVDGGSNMTPSLLVTDPISGSTSTIWSAASAIQGGDNIYSYYFADGASGGSYRETTPIGAPGVTWQFRMSHNNANSVTYSVSGILLP